MSKGRSQNGVEDMSWPTDKEGLVDNLGTFLILFFKKTREIYYNILFYFLILPLILSYHLLLFPLVWEDDMIVMDKGIP